MAQPYLPSATFFFYKIQCPNIIRLLCRPMNSLILSPLNLFFLSSGGQGEHAAGMLARGLQAWWRARDAEGAAVAQRGQA